MRRLAMLALALATLAPLPAGAGADLGGSEPAIAPAAAMSVPGGPLRDGTGRRQRARGRRLPDARGELGGSTVAELYDVRRGSFAAAGRLHEWRDDHTATRLGDGRVLGYDDGIEPTAQAWLYD